MRYIVTLAALVLSATEASCASATPPAASALTSRLPASVTPMSLTNDTNAVIDVNPGAENCMKKSVPRMTLRSRETWKGDLETTADCPFSPSFDIRFDSTRSDPTYAKGTFYKRASEPWAYDPQPSRNGLRVRVIGDPRYVSAEIFY